MDWLELCYNLCIAGVLFLAAGGVGQLLFYLLRIKIDNIETLWFSLVGGLGLLSILILFLGLLNLLYAWIFGIILAFFSLVAIHLLWRQRDQWRQQILNRGVFGGGDRIFQVVLYILLFLSLSSIVWIWLTHALMPPNEWDEIAYHIAIPKLYILEHHIFYIPYIFTAQWPMNNEMLFIAMLLLDAELAPHFISLGMAALTAIGLVLAGRRIGDLRVGVIAAALFCTVPLVKRLAGTALIDVSMGLYVLAGLLALDRWRQTRQLNWLVISGLMCGFVAGCKLTGAAFPALLALVVIARGWAWQQLTLRLALWRGCILGLASLSVVAPWYMRSYIWTGNPIWPFAFQVFGGRNWDLLGDEYNTFLQHAIWTPQIPRSLGGLIESYIYVVSRPSDMGGYAGGIGIALPLGGLLAAAFTKRISSLAATGLFVSAAFYVLWFAVVSLQVRYLLPIAPLLAIGTASLFVVGYEALQFFPWRLGVLVVMLALIINTWPWSSTGERALFLSRWDYLSGRLSREAWLDSQIGILPVFRYAELNLPQDAHILLLPFENRGYYLDREYVWGNPLGQRYIRFEQFKDVRELAGTLQRMNIGYVIDEPAVVFDRIRYWPQIHQLMVELRERCGAPLYRLNDQLLYKLRPCDS